MGQIKPHQPVLLILAAFSRHETALEWAQQQVTKHWGPIGLISPAFAFTETGYYEKTMGDGLLKQFYAFEQLVDPTAIIAGKITSNDWEAEYATQSSSDQMRPLNLDPGYISLAKLVLATTKDRDHRLYLGQGIYAENTIFFQSGQWRHRPWTYPDYQREDFQQFFTQCRNYLKSRRIESLTHPDP